MTTALKINCAASTPGGILASLLDGEQVGFDVGQMLAALGEAVLEQIVVEGSGWLEVTYGWEPQMNADECRWKTEAASARIRAWLP